MSATILDHAAFCRSVGLDPAAGTTKFIQTGSDFPVENRPIYPLNTAYLNYNSLSLEEIRKAIALTVDKIMTKYKDQKGIIHTTSYAQLDFIRPNLSRENRARLVMTGDPKLKRAEVMKEHIESDRPTVLISPWLFLGIDLIEDLSRFQIIVKVPYPSKGDRWTDAKRERDQSWYYWHTALRLIQAYGRSVRSKDDWAHTYILDAAFQYFIRKNRMPSWFMEAISKMS